MNRPSQVVAKKAKRQSLLDLLYWCKLSHPLGYEFSGHVWHQHSISYLMTASLACLSLAGSLRNRVISWLHPLFRYFFGFFRGINLENFGCSLTHVTEVQMSRFSNVP